MAATLFSRFLETDTQARIQPGLLASWKVLTPESWEFKLRPGVKFHNGEPFTAEDVAFTIARLPLVVNSPGSFTTYTRTIKDVEVVDPLTVRITTQVPNPSLLVDLARVAVINRRTHENATTDEFNAGTMAIGTGPYRLVQHRSGDRVLLERNEEYWGDKPAWERVDYRMITSDPARTAALLSGDVDIIDQVATSDLKRLRGDPRIVLSEIESLRNAFLVFDHSRTGDSPFITDNDGKPFGHNPLKDVRVRRALSLAIDREAIVSRVMEGNASVSAQFVGKGVFGYAPDLVPPRQDVEQAKSLLAEAGYPEGFRITLHGSNDRYPNDGRTIQAVGQMWSRIGVRTAIEAMPFTSYIGRAGKQEILGLLCLLGQLDRRDLGGAALDPGHLRPGQGAGCGEPRALLQPGIRRQAARRHGRDGRREARAEAAGSDPYRHGGFGHPAADAVQQRLGHAARPGTRGAGG